MKTVTLAGGDSWPGVRGQPLRPQVYWAQSHCPCGSGLLPEGTLSTLFSSKSPGSEDLEKEQHRRQEAQAQGATNPQRVLSKQMARQGLTLWSTKARVFIWLVLYIFSYSTSQGNSRRQIMRSK